MLPTVLNETHNFQCNFNFVNCDALILIYLFTFSTFLYFLAASKMSNLSSLKQL